MYTTAPSEFREACYILHAMEQKFPGRLTNAVTTFLFLRFFCPAIVAPDMLGVLDDTESIPTSKCRQALVMVSKVIQKLKLVYI